MRPTQALSFAMAAYGFTIEHDGWRFEPVPDEMSWFVVCRGQVIPDADHTLDYEVFIEEIVDGPIPTVYAALLCRSDGFKVFHARRFGIRLVPDWPMPPGCPGPVQYPGRHHRRSRRLRCAARLWSRHALGRVR